MRLKDLFRFARSIDLTARPGVASAVCRKAMSPEAGLDGAREMVTFGVTLPSSRTTSDWSRTCLILAQTLRSVLRQTDRRFRVIVCGHEMPELEELDDPRLEFWELQASPPSQPDRFRNDKFKKRFNIGRRLHQLGGGYYMQLDSDDLVHKDLVGTVLCGAHPHGYTMPNGYASDWSAGIVAPVPGVWSFGLDRVCGSTSVLFFSKEDLPSSNIQDLTQMFNMCAQHNMVVVAFEEEGRLLEVLDLPAVVYTINHSQNLSFRLQRGGRRKEYILARIRDLALSDPDALRCVNEDFGAAFQVGGRPVPV